MMPPAKSSVDECPVVLAAGGAAGPALGRPGGPVRGRALVPAAVAAVGGGERGGRGRGAVSRQYRRAAARSPPAGRSARRAGPPRADARLQADAARRDWDDAMFAGPDGGCDAALLDRQRRRSATRHLSTRAWFYPLLFGRRLPSARWRTRCARCQSSRRSAAPLADPARLYGAAIDAATVEICARLPRSTAGANTGCAHRRRRRGCGKVAGSERLYARIVEPAGRLRTDADLRQRPLPGDRPSVDAARFAPRSSRRWAGG